MLCIGFQLPDFSLSDLSIISKEFIKPVYFSGSQFFGKADFYKAHFQGLAIFSGAHFQGFVDFSGAHFQVYAMFYDANFQEGASFSEADFQRGAEFNNSEFYGKTHFSAHFNGKTTFYNVLFDGKDNVIFNIENLSNVSFINTDITGVRFSDKARWRRGGEKKVKEGKYRYVSTQLKDVLQVTMLVLIYEQLLPTLLLFCLLERAGSLFPYLLADRKDLDVDNSLVP